MTNSTTIIVFGASGDLAKKKTFPALFGIFKHGLMPSNCKIIGYARSNLTRSQFEELVKLNLKDRKELIPDFLKMCEYESGKYDKNEDFQKLNLAIEKHENTFGAKLHYRERIFYLALPPIVYVDVSTMINKFVYLKGARNKLVIEKPFGKDLKSSRDLNEKLTVLFHEEEIFRIDHYLGKEMVKNILPMRFANLLFESIWNNRFIDNIQITCSESFGTEGRSGYFDEFGIIRDIIQNHLTQILCYVAMEDAKSLDANDIRDMKVKLLKEVMPIKDEDILIGQYTRSEDETKPAYVDDNEISNDSNTPTFAAVVLRINNDRWRNVPFIIKCGKALEKSKVEIRVQFKDVKNNLFCNMSRNELVIRLQPKEAVYLKFMNKLPGLEMKTAITELDLTYKTRYPNNEIPEAYESLLLDVLNDNQSNFVRDDELDVAWQIFTPILEKIDNNEIKCEKYPYGSKGPNSLYKFIEKNGYKKNNSEEHTWSPRASFSGKL